MSAAPVQPAGNGFHCRACKADNERSAERCVKCGHSLLWLCPSCGTKNSKALPSCACGTLRPTGSKQRRALKRLFINYVLVATVAGLVLGKVANKALKPRSSSSGDGDDEGSRGFMAQVEFALSAMRQDVADALDSNIYFLGTFIVCLLVGVGLFAYRNPEYFRKRKRRPKQVLNAPAK